jgi:hypothetical protein
MDFADWFNRRVAPTITRLGITPRSVTLEVRGRRSGRPIRLSISPARFEGQRYLVSLAGERGWVRNARAADGEAVLIHGRRVPVRLVEVPVQERAPILLAWVSERAFSRSPKRAARLYFGLEAPSLADMEARAAEYPVFAIQPRDE